MMEIRTVWHITREYRGIAEAGGIKDVVRDLSEALRESGIAVGVVIPFYGSMEGLPFRSVRKFRVPGLIETDLREQNGLNSFEALSCEVNGVSIYALKSDVFSRKYGVYTYTESEAGLNPRYRKGEGHEDAVQLSLLFQRAAVEFMRLTGAEPTIVHCHDAHAACVPAIMREVPVYRQTFSETACVVTIHNAGPGYHQEIHDIDLAARLTALPLEVLRSALLHRAVTPFLLAARYATLNTVSENYARELLTIDSDTFSAGLGAELRRRNVDLTGISNGINTDFMDPRCRAQSGIPCCFDPSDGVAAGKAGCKHELLRRVNEGELPNGLKRYGRIEGAGDSPLYVFQARITAQKGIAELLTALDSVHDSTPAARFIFLGQGEAVLETALARKVQSPQMYGRACFINGYDEELTKLLLAGSDFFLFPSLYEPCGITDLFAWMMGSIPIVHSVGGLVKVENGRNGYAYTDDRPDGAELSRTIEESYRDYFSDGEKLITLRKNGFHTVISRYSWKIIVPEKYLPFYRKSLRQPVFQ